MKKRLVELAHARSGDKGDIANIALFAPDRATYDLLLREVTAERVRNHFCRQAPGGLPCQSYQEIWDESVHDESPAMRSNIKSQCQSKIDRLKEEDGVTVR